MDVCTECGKPIYPDDEAISLDMERYHIECAESANIYDKE